MCIVLCCINRSEEYPFILISNRDEFFIRKTLKLSLQGSIVSPYDLARSNGGTWMGLNIKNGAVCCLVNYREPVKTLSKISRGILPLTFLNDSVEEFEDFYKKNKEDIGGFSFVYGNVKQNGEFHAISNRSIDKTFKSGEIFGLSNSKIAEPWPKVVKGEALLGELMDKDIKDQEVLVKELFKILSTNNFTKEPSIDQVRESIFIPPIKTLKKDDQFFGEYYGTRTQTIILVDKMGKATYLEKTLHDEDMPMVKDHLEKFEFDLANGAPA